MIEKDDKFLIIKENKFPFWRIPGGRVEWGEDIDEAVKREIKEELDIDIEIIKNLGHGQDKVVVSRKGKAPKEGSRILIIYHCKIKSGEVKIMEEDTSDFKWVTLDEIKNHDNFEPAVQDFFKRFEFK